MYHLFPQLSNSEKLSSEIIDEPQKRIAVLMMYYCNIPVLMA